MFEAIELPTSSVGNTIDFNTTNRKCSSMRLDNPDVRSNGASWAGECNPTISFSLWPGTAKSVTSVDLVTVLSRLAAVRSSHEFDRGDCCISSESNLLPVACSEIAVGASLSGSVGNVGLNSSFDQPGGVPRPSWIDARIRGRNKFELDRSIIPPGASVVDTTVGIAQALTLIVVVAVSSFGVVFIG